MTEEIKCKYKFQNKDKFNGKKYCTLFNELCENVSFVCDNNCQVYEDFKQLKRLEQKYNEVLKLAKENADSNEYCLQENDEIIGKLQKENEELENKYSKIKDKEWDAYYYVSSVKSIFEGARGAIEELLKMKLPKKIKYWVNIADMYLHFREETINKEIEEVNNKYKQALEEVREIVLENPWEETDNWIKGKILEVLESEEK